MGLEETESGVRKSGMGGARKDGLDDRVGGFGGGDKGGCAGFGSRSEASAAEFDWEEGLGASGVSERVTEKPSERLELKSVKVSVDGEKGFRIASSETVGKFGEGEAEAEEAIFKLGVIEGGKDVKDGGDLFHSGGYDVA